jgi:hypothetical protein
MVDVDLPYCNVLNKKLKYQKERKFDSSRSLICDGIFQFDVNNFLIEKHRSCSVAEHWRQIHIVEGWIPNIE